MNVGDCQTRPSRATRNISQTLYTVLWIIIINLLAHKTAEGTVTAVYLKSYCITMKEYGIWFVFLLESHPPICTASLNDYSPPRTNRSR